jgi:hypothetical protein
VAVHLVLVAFTAILRHFFLFVAACLLARSVETCVLFATSCTDRLQALLSRGMLHVYIFRKLSSHRTHAPMFYPTTPHILSSSLYRLTYLYKETLPLFTMAYHVPLTDDNAWTEPSISLRVTPDALSPVSWKTDEFETRTINLHFRDYPPDQ